MRGLALIAVALRMLRRDWRSGELAVLTLALVVAVGSVTTVGFFADRVREALSRQANQLLGADLALVADRGVPEAFASEAARRGLQQARSYRFPSMVGSGGESLLAEVKAVTPGYPLRGELRIAERLDGPERPARSVPAPGTVWVDRKLAARLGIDTGALVEVGRLRLPVAAIVTDEPDQTIGFTSLGPRLLMALADLPATELIQPGSRVTYRLLLAGEPRTIDDFRSWAEPQLEPGQKLEGVRDARPEVKNALEKADQFLGLAALAAVVLAAAAIALAARRFALRHLDGCAMMRCLGARQRQIVALHAWHLATLGLAGSAAGCVVGFAAQAVLGRVLGALVGAELPPPTPLPALHGLIAGATLLLGFALPPILNLRNVPTLRVLRREIGPPRGASVAGYGAGVGMLAALVLWRASDLKLGLYVIAGFGAALALFAALSWLALKALRGAQGVSGVTWRYGLASMRRRAGASVVQAVALGLGLMALLTLTIVRGDLLSSWQSRLPPDAPNRFLINIQPEQVEPVSQFLEAHGVARPALFPMVRGRLVAINGRPVVSDDYPDPRARRLVEREFNLSWAEEVQHDNRIVEGEWWRAGDRGSAQLSVEEGIAQTLGIRLGDSLTYDVAGTRFEAKVSSLRAVEWDTFRVNFFVIATPGLLDGFPVSYITAFHLSSARLAVMNELVRRFPTVLAIDVTAIMAQVQRTIDQVSRAVEFVFLFTLAAGIVVLYAALVSTQDERRFEAAIFRTLGGRRAQLMQAHAAEFLALGAMAGLLAALGAAGLGYALAVHVLQLPYRFNGWIFPLGLVAGALGVAVAGLLGTRSILDHPPLAALRRLGNL
jgi:putative ABC transport system permease protein